MTPVVTIDTSEFHAAMREYLARTKSTLAEATNRRMFFLLARAFTLLKPHAAQPERNRIRAYLNTPVGTRRMDKGTGKFVGKGRQLQRRHLIVQAKNKAAGKPGLYGEDMKKAAAKLSRYSIGSVGYIKSVVAKAIKQLRGSFTQFGRSVKIKLQPGQSRRETRQIDPNAALVRLAAEYGTSQDNVAMHKGGRAYVLKAREGFSPSVIADMAITIANGQEARVDAEYTRAFTRAYADELTELRRHLAAVMQADADRFNAA